MKDVKMTTENKIPILIIAPFFAPQSHAAMFRVHKLVKYLPDYGYKPIVITTDINYNYNEDLSLLEELDECVEIHRVRYIEPTMRGLRMALGGKDRTFNAMKKSNKLDSTHNNPSKTNSININQIFLTKIKSKIQHFILNMPDAYWTWINPAIKKAKNLIKSNDIKLFYTTCNPNSVLKIGIELKKSLDVHWISDFRDPVGYIDRYKTPNRYFRKNDQKTIQEAMNQADFITGLASSYENIFIDLYGIKKEKFQFIPTGLDDQYIPNHSIKSNDEEFLLFSGEFLIEYGEYFFEVYNKLMKNDKFKDIKIYFIGRKEINEPMVLNLLKEYPKIMDNLVFIDHIPQLKLYELIKSSKACLLVAGFDSRWYCNYAKMVDYIALQKPTITVVPQKSEARQELDKANLGYHLTGNMNKDVDLLSNFLFDSNIKDNEYYKTYLASSQVTSFVKIFDNLLRKSNEK